MSATTAPQAEQVRHQQAQIWMTHVEARVHAQEAKFAEVQSQQASALQHHWNALNAQNRELNAEESTHQHLTEDLRRQAEAWAQEV